MLPAQKRLATSGLLMLALALLAQQAICDINAINNVPINTTPGPKGVPANNGAAQAPVTNAPISKTDAKAATSAAPSKAPAPVPQPPPPPPPPPTTAKPAVQAVVVTTNLPAAPAPALAGAAAGAAVAPAASNPSPGQRLAAYFEPICDNLDKLLPEHYFKIQTQMKQFIERTTGKMSVCFMQHYMIDPNLAPVSKQELATICSSRTLPANTNGSFKDFQACAEHNWDKNLDQGLEQIIRLRLNCFINHAHSKNDSTISLLHGTDEAMLIGEVVGKVLNDNKSNGPNVKPNITIINVGPANASAPAPLPAPATKAPPAPSAPPAPTKVQPAPPSPNDRMAATKKILNDPNTVLVLVDDSSTTKAPPANAAGAPGTQVVVTMTTPTPVAPKSTTAAPVLDNKPAPTSLGAKILNAATTGASLPAAPTKPAAPAAPAAPVTMAPSTAKPVVSPGSLTTQVPATSKPTVIVVSTVAPSAQPVKPVLVGSTTAAPNKDPTGPATSAAPSTTTTKKPAPAATTKAAGSTAKPAATTAKPMTTLVPAATSTAPTKNATSGTGKPGPSTTVSPTPKPQDKGQQKSDAKTKKDKDEADAKNAIKALQMQRAGGHVDDARMHQIEHERQMTIDPVGHILKHQQYEQMKLARTSTKAPPSSSPPSKKS